jgi:hypothetical protein
VVIPPLPPREASGSSVAGAGTPYPAAAQSPYGAPAPAYGTTNSPYGNAGAPNGSTGAPYGNTGSPYGNTGSPYGSAGAPYGSTGAPYGNTGSPYGSNVPQVGGQAQVGSLGAQRGAGGYGSVAVAPQWTPPTGPAPAVPPSGGPCRLVVSPDRSTLQLADAGTRAVRQHVPLGENRVQKVFDSPDGAWALAIFKVRGVAQYAAIGINLARCEAGEPIDVPAVASAAQFEGVEAVLTFDGSVQRLPLPKGTP